ncbi:hypothetical protein EDC04DRAFT_2606117 [Pisolithus marmoratus]|nr:hypothetical protein EDC04DRAFT_2606117 [Pisolithus marmoratus]
MENGISRSQDECVTRREVAIAATFLASVLSLLDVQATRGSWEVIEEQGTMHRSSTRAGHRSDLPLSHHVRKMHVVLKGVKSLYELLNGDQPLLELLLTSFDLLEISPVLLITNPALLIISLAILIINLALLIISLELLIIHLELMLSAPR